MSDSNPVNNLDLSYDDLKDFEDRHASGASVKLPISIERGLASTVWDVTGKSYLDFTSGMGVANVGHNHPAVVSAIKDQLDRLAVCSDSFYQSERARLLDELTRITAADLNRVFLANSGAEAIETAIKLARTTTKRAGIVALKKAFHGRTLGALSATWNPKYKKGVQPLLPEVEHVPNNDIEELERSVTSNTAAVIIELIQGESGIWPLDPAMIHAARRLCSERGALLIIDEIQTGYGRTGTMFAYEWANVIPDILCLGKGIAGGLPMSATVWRDGIGRFDPGMHGSTFGGFPLVCASARAVLKVMENEKLADRAEHLGLHLSMSLASINSPLIRDIRGRGLMVGIDLRIKAAPIIRVLAERGILVLRAGTTVIRFLPPLVITKEEIDRMIQILGDVLEAAWA